MLLANSSFREREKMLSTTISMEFAQTRPMKKWTEAPARPMSMIQIEGGKCVQAMAIDDACMILDQDVALLSRRISELYVDTFLLSERLVTNHEFKQFIDAGGYCRRDYWKDLFEVQYYPGDLARMERILLFKDTTNFISPAFWSSGCYRPGTEDLPVEGISWYEAAAYARWKGARLPLEKEWEFALRQFQQRPAPVVPFPQRRRSRRTVSRGPLATLRLPDCLGEWMADDHQACDSETGVVRGGRFNAPAGCVNPWFRLAVRRLERSAGVGFRCAAAY
jgi:formylglycine-generating enzyme required for sulfatase activity